MSSHSLHDALPISAKAIAKLFVQVRIELGVRQPAKKLSLFGPAAPDDAVDVVTLGMRQGGERSRAGKAFVGPTGLRSGGPHIGEHRMLAVTALQTNRPDTV